MSKLLLFLLGLGGFIVAFQCLKEGNAPGTIISMFSGAILISLI